MSTPAPNKSKDLDRIEAYIKDPRKFKRGVVLTGALVCPDCQSKSRSTECDHYLKYCPPWRDTSQLVDQIKHAPLRLKEDLACELFGLAPIDHSTLISSDLVNAFSVRPFFKVDVTELATPFVIFMADPAHGSERSQFALMMSVFILRDGLIHKVIVAMDSVDMRHVDHNVLESIVKEFVSVTVNAFPWMRRSGQLVPFIEDNGSYTTAHSIYKAAIEQAKESGLPVNRHYITSEVVCTNPQTPLQLTSLPCLSSHPTNTGSSVPQLVQRRRHSHGRVRQNKRRQSHN
jgi:hypothetical protein